MPRRKPDYRALPSHPAVKSLPYMGRYCGYARVMVKIECPRCHEMRERGAAETRKEMSRPTWKGLCRKCALASLSEGSHRWVHKKRVDPNRTHINGYVNVLIRDVPDHLLPWYRSMQKKGQPVMEHRWVMAQALGRPLDSNEFVDHMDGNKHNNLITNLRVYVRGKNQQGSCPAHGTYYDEWQKAKAEVKRLKALLRTLGHGDRI